VKEIAPYFIDPITDESLPGREEMWHIVAGYRVRLAIEAQQWIEAERLQRMIVKWLRSHADSVIAAPRETLDDRQRNVIQSLAIALEWLGNILHEQSSPECVKVYKQAISLCQHIGDKMEEAILSFQLGHVHLQNPALRDFVKSEYWYQHSLELSDEHDYLWHGKCFNQMGAVSYDRFFKALEAGQPEEELLRNLNAAAQFYHQALKALNRLPLNGVNAVDDLAVTHNRLGMICGDTGDIDRALSHYREAIRYEEASGDLYSAANSCYGVAFYLARDGRFDEALLYAQAALRGFKTYGNKAAADIQKTQELIAEIEYACANASLHSAQNDI
jgi:tetratricopeptide (TPR) repeat protein